jgi:hypothetical protein
MPKKIVYSLASGTEAQAEYVRIVITHSEFEWQWQLNAA